MNLLGVPGVSKTDESSWLLHEDKGSEDEFHEMLCIIASVLQICLSFSPPFFSLPLSLLIYIIGDNR